MVADLTTISLPGRPVASGELLLGPENRMVATVPELLADSRAGRLVVIYGPLGVGKSHLAYGLVARALASQPDAEAVYFTGADYARAYACACQSDAMDDFTRRHRSCRLLAIDTVCELAGKVPAQTHLMHTVDAVLSSGGTVLATLRCSPGEHQALIDPLVSRLLGGWSVSMAPPAETTRLSVVHYLAARHSLDFDEQSAAELARLFRSVGQLTSAVAQLASASAGRITNRDLAAYLDTQRADRASLPPNVNSIAKMVARRSGVTLKELRGSSRRATLVRVRGLAMIAARRLTGAAYRRIGEYFGGRDHSTVMHACRQAEKQIENDDELAAIWNQIADALDEHCSSHPTPLCKSR